METTATNKKFLKTMTYYLEVRRCIGYRKYNWKLKSIVFLELILNDISTG